MSNEISLLSYQEVKATYLQRIQEQGIEATLGNMTVNGKHYAVIKCSPNLDVFESQLKAVDYDHTSIANVLAKWCKIIFGNEDPRIKTQLSVFFNLPEIKSEARLKEAEYQARIAVQQRTTSTLYVEMIDVPAVEFSNEELNHTIDLESLGITSSTLSEEELTEDDELTVDEDEINFSAFPIYQLPALLTMLDDLPLFVFKILRTLSPKEKEALDTIVNLSDIEEQVRTLIADPQTAAQRQVSNHYISILVKAIDELPLPKSEYSAAFPNCPISFESLTLENAMELNCRGVWKPISRDSIKSVITKKPINPLNNDLLDTSDFRQFSSPYQSDSNETHTTST
ncbi:hypothetical protein D5R81_10025 [Parashewanella spongiae]|uniref:Uncharacterized protein n=1 Tax=Parashewanella spongiae TaxID=342950 RepID=A0A3A6U917_9GAMM|nr:hypothetical protein [Parashewanella spongiae]MCL1079738.1 hypothetical protein [Parashewanella spongiae]RJY15124.1 hypothetical protein D5R81_10025 [Parashewanella spongiae]